MATTPAHNLPLGYYTFFHDVLSSPAGSLIKSPLWVIAFENLSTRILPAIRKALQYEPGIIQSSRPVPGAPPGTSWAIEEAARIITHDSYQTTAGCMLCQGIDLPGININAIPEGNINYNAFLRSYVGQGRVDFPQMRMTFLDTNISFADNFLRPWALATATFGMLARDRSSTENYRTDLQCWQLGAYDAEQPPTILKQMTFYDICCVSVNNEELNYLTPSGPLLREAQFIYNYYTLKTSQEINEFITLAVQGGTQPPDTGL